MGGLGQFGLQLLKGRWMMVVASFYIKAFSGASYAFGIYSIPIKASLNYDQRTIDTLGFFKDLGANIGIFAGLMSEVMPQWVVLIVGAAMNLFGYLMIWLAVTHRIPPPPLWQMYLFMCIGADSQAFANTPVMVTCLKNFPHSRGVLFGFIKGFGGLSGAIFSQLYYSLDYASENNSHDILLLVAWLPGAINILFMFFIRTIKVDNISMEDVRKENKRWFSFLYIALILAGFFILVNILENQIALSSSVQKVIATVTLLLVVSNIVVAIEAEREKLKKPKAREANPTSSPGTIENSTESAALKVENAETINISTDDQCTEANTSEDARKGIYFSTKERSLEDASKHILSSTNGRSLEDASKDMPSSTNSKLNIKEFKSAWAIKGAKRGDDFTIPQALISWDMWLLFIASTCGIGTSLAAMDNMGQIGESLGYSRVSISTLVSLLNIWNFLGRLLAGFVSEELLKKKGIPRTLVFTIFMVIGCAGHVLIAVPTKGSLYGACVIVGVSFGGQWTLMSTIISELFGVRYFATLYNVGALANPLGSYLMNVRVAGPLYDQQTGFLQEGGGLTCIGSHCFASIFLIMASVAFLGSLVSALLVFRTFAFYRLHAIRTT